MFTAKNILISFLLLFAVSLSGWSIFISKHAKTALPHNVKDPDAYMENIVATIINDEGVRTLTIQSPYMLHYPENDTTDIETPHIIVYRDTPEPWHIYSKFAKASQGIYKIIFSGNVVIHHANDISTPRTTMKTQSLTVFPKNNIAQTEEPISVQQPATSIHATGMLANLNDGTVKLLSATRGRYVPN